MSEHPKGMDIDLHQLKFHAERCLLQMRLLGNGYWATEIEQCKRLRDRATHEEDLLLDLAEVPAAFTEVQS